LSFAAGALRGSGFGRLLRLLGLLLRLGLERRDALGVDVVDLDDFERLLGERLDRRADALADQLGADLLDHVVPDLQLDAAGVDDVAVLVRLAAHDQRAEGDSVAGTATPCSISFSRPAFASSAARCCASFLSASILASTLSLMPRTSMAAPRMMLSLRISAHLLAEALLGPRRQHLEILRDGGDDSRRSCSPARGRSPGSAAAPASWGRLFRSSSCCCSSACSSCLRVWCTVETAFLSGS
jgi:hypothetical protein